MYRRRRQQREKIAFGFDCFLDVVTNVIGIIIRLILVAWVGGRSYSAVMQWREAPPPGPVAPVAALPAPRAEDDPLTREIEARQRQIDAARAKLLEQFEQIGAVQKQQKTLEGQLASLERDRGKLNEERQLV